MKKIRKYAIFIDICFASLSHADLIFKFSRATPGTHLVQKVVKALYGVGGIA